MQSVAPFISSALPFFLISLLLSISNFPVHTQTPPRIRERNHAGSRITSRAQSSVNSLNYPLQPDTGDTIPAAPVQWQPDSCSLDLNDQLLGGVKTACMMGTMDRARCCPVLAAWLMAARSKVALHAPPPDQEPGMPVLPDDSLVCIASMKAALESRGFYLKAPNDSCDVVTCFCGIKLNEITIASCPLTFSDRTNSSSRYQFQNSSTKNSVSLVVTTKNSHPSVNIPTEPAEPSTNDTVVVPGLLPVGNVNGSSLLQELAANCTDHSYRGCTRCLTTLQQEVTRGSAGSLELRNSSVKATDCELIGLMWLLDINKTFYIPTVSAVLRALIFNDHPTKACSPDTANMPLALDYSEILLSSSPKLVLESRSWVMPTMLLIVLSHANLLLFR